MANEIKATDSRHRGCGGIVLASLDGESCARCGAELKEDDWFTEPMPYTDADRSYDLHAVEADYGRPG